MFDVPRGLRCSPIPMAPLFQPISGIITDASREGGPGSAREAADALDLTAHGHGCGRAPALTTSRRPRKRDAKKSPGGEAGARMGIVQRGAPIRQSLKRCTLS